MNEFENNYLNNKQILEYLYSKYQDEVSNFDYLNLRSIEEYRVYLLSELKDFKCIYSLESEINYVIFYFETLDNKIEINLCGYYFDDLDNIDFIKNFFKNKDLIFHVYHHDYKTKELLKDHQVIRSNGIKKYENEYYCFLDDNCDVMAFNKKSKYVSIGNKKIDADLIWTNDSNILDKFDIYEDIYEVKND